MNIIADFHTHTISCNHAFSTLEENVRGAKRAGLQYLALTEHGPSSEGGPHPYLLGNIHLIPPTIDGVHMIRGYELNILDGEGSLDLPEELISRADFVLAGLHPETPYTCQTCEEHTNTLINVMSNPYVDAIAHPDNPNFPVDFARLVSAAVERGVMLEVNNASCIHTPGRGDGKHNLLQMLRIGKREGLQICLGSDAHISYAVGHFKEALQLIKEVEYPEEYIINTSKDRIEKYFQKRQKRIKKR